MVFGILPHMVAGRGSLGYRSSGPFFSVVMYEGLGSECVRSLLGQLVLQ